MIKQIWIAECDCCGKVVPAVEKSGYRDDPIYLPPDNWGRGYNQSFIVCPDCKADCSLKKLLTQEKQQKGLW